MNQFSGATARAKRKIIFLNKRHAQSARSGIQRNASSRDATANDEQIKLLCLKMLDDLRDGCTEKFILKLLVLLSGVVRSIKTKPNNQLTIHQPSFVRSTALSQPL